MTKTQASGVTLVEEIPLQSEEANAYPAHLGSRREARDRANAFTAARGPKRMELRVSEDFLHALDLLARDESLTRADIIRRAVGLYARARIEQNNGRSLAFAAPQGNQLVVQELIAI